MDFYEEFGQIFSQFDESKLNYLMEFGLAIVGVLLLVILIAMVLGIVCYVLQSAGLYSIASRRGIHNPWLAWIPIAQYWIFGCVSDQYQYVVKGKITNRRKILLGLGIAQVVLNAVNGALNNAMLYSFGNGRFPMVSSTPFAVLIFSGINAILSVTMMVFFCICLYDLYSSCCPENNVLFLVLGIIFSITTPFFIFCNRKKERGMPPRVQQPVYQAPAYQPPVYQPPVYEQPEDPWNNQ